VWALIQAEDHSERTVLVDYFVVETTDVTQSQPLHYSSQVVMTAHTLLHYIIFNIIYTMNSQKARMSHSRLMSNVKNIYRRHRMSRVRIGGAEYDVYCDVNYQLCMMGYLA